MPTICNRELSPRLKRPDNTVDAGYRLIIKYSSRSARQTTKCSAADGKGLDHGQPFVADLPDWLASAVGTKTVRAATELGVERAIRKMAEDVAATEERVEAQLWVKLTGSQHQPYHGKMHPDEKGGALGIEFKVMRLVETWRGGTLARSKHVRLYRLPVPAPELDEVLQMHGEDAWRADTDGWQILPYESHQLDRLRELCARLTDLSEVVRTALDPEGLPLFLDGQAALPQLMAADPSER